MAESNSATPVVNTEIESGRFDEKDTKPTTAPAKKKEEDDDEEEDIVSVLPLRPPRLACFRTKLAHPMLVAPR